MARSPLPQTTGSTLLTDSGIETEIIFGVGRDLPAFAVFPLLSDLEGRDILERYYREHVAVAAEHGLGYVFETPSYRSSADWGTTLGYSQEELDSLDREGVAFLEWIRATGSDGLGPSPISGLLGPRGDGYVVGATLTPELARAYHSHQIGVFADAGCDLVSGCTLNYADEGLGIGLAARDHDIPVMLYFTLETDGRLPDGSRLRDAIRRVDDATGGYVSYYGINCAHPDHIEVALGDLGDEGLRVRAIRANASRLSHAELDVAEELDPGDPVELSSGYSRLLQGLPNASVFGGCCGTSVTHISRIAAALTTA